MALTARAEDVSMPVPDGVMAPDVPTDNPRTAAKVELGRKLYFAEHKSVSDGVAGGKGVRNAPTARNAAIFQKTFGDSKVMIARIGQARASRWRPASAET